MSNPIPDSITAYLSWTPPNSLVDVTQILIVFYGGGAQFTQTLPANRTSTTTRQLFRGIAYHVEVCYGRTLNPTFGGKATIDFVVPLNATPDQ